MGNISSRIKPLREILGLGQELFGRAVGVKKTTITAIEHGRQRVTEGIIEAIAEKWPQYIFWFVSGKTDEKNGHISPEIERIRRDSEQGKEATG